MTHPLVTALNATPVDRVARRVASQRNCSETYHDLDREELKAVLERLHRKNRLVRHLLGITTAKQAENLRARVRKNFRSKKFDNRLAREFVAIGSSIRAAADQLKSMPEPGLFPKDVRIRLGHLENAWKAEHPGWIWDGRQCVAPNGDVFDRRTL